MSWMQDFYRGLSAIWSTMTQAWSAALQTHSDAQYTANYDGFPDAGEDRLEDWRDDQRYLGLTPWWM